MRRECGGCTLCCKLLAVNELDKRAGERCKHQSHAKGCAVYQKAAMPASCALWNCRWLFNDDTADLSRPDRSHYVLDILPDYVSVTDNATGEKTNLEVIQIWCDPNHPDAHRDPALRAYLERRAIEGKIGLVRYNARDAFALMPPAMSADRQWHEQGGKVDPTRKYSLMEVARALNEP
jgi:hypothetical protein